MIKVYARQVPPEYQESPLFYSDWDENVFVFGNRDYKQRAETLDNIRQALEEIADEWENINNHGHGYYNSWIDALNDLFPARDDGREYNRAERLELAKLAAQYEWASSDTENNILCRVLELITGRAWECATIRGYCQGDWQEIIYPATYGRDWLEAFETEYFNTGTEWTIHDDETPPESPESITGYNAYCLGWNDEKIRAEIAEYANVSPDDVVLYEFTGWTRAAAYREV